MTKNSDISIQFLYTLVMSTIIAPLTFFYFLHIYGQVWMVT